ncbi:GumC family protein [Leptolyngbya ohadii]|uniref:GumC family protein n=1 Tax=Leptolyngbya ohadii TaxID=1962290 RepID=UPI000B59AD06|nr:tyrosine-protein kinase domain-containing protein [Leptolyngbya ohadii]
METEQTVQSSAPSMRGRSIPPLPPVDLDEADVSPNRGINLRALGRTIQRQALLIAGVATVTTALAIFQAMKIPRSYEGDFQLLVEPVTNEARIADPLTVTRTEGGVPGRDVFTLDYATQIEILKSPEMLNSIVQQVKTEYPDFSFVDLRQGLTVERLQPEGSPDATRIIKANFSGDDPGLVQKVLKVTANRFLQYSLEDRKSRFGEGIKFIEDQLPELQQRVTSLQDQLQRLQQQYNLLDPASQGSQLSGQVNDITSLRLETERQLQEQRTLYRNLQQQLRLSPQEAIAASALSEDPSYRELQAAQQEVQRQIAIETARFSDRSPVVRSLRQREANLNALMNQQAQRIVGQAPAPVPTQQGSGGTSANPAASSAAAPPAGNPQVLAFQNSIRLGLIEQLVNAGNQIQMLEARSREINQASGQFARRLQQFPAIARQYNDLTRELQIATQTLDRLLSQRETLRVEAAQTEIPWEIVSEPTIPRDADGNPVPAPSRAQNMVIAGVGLGLLLGTLLALLLERYRNMFYTIEDIQETIKLPTAGVIPFSRGAKQSLDFPMTFGALGDMEDNRLETAAFRESFSDLYSNIRLAEPPIHALMVTSAEPGDGKTTIALYLAQTAAGAGQRVLLVDTNLRQPQLQNRLDLRNVRGLSDLLTSNTAAEEVIQQSPLADNLYVLAAGSMMPGSARLLGSDQMKQLMEKFRASFDLVIYDTSHLFGVTDASFLTAEVDEVLLVIATGKTNRSTVQRVLNKLTGLPMAGVSLVVNHLREQGDPTGTYNSYSQKAIASQRDGQPSIRL